MRRWTTRPAHETDDALRSLAALGGGPLTFRLALSGPGAQRLLACKADAGPGSPVAAGSAGCGRGGAGPQRGGLCRSLAALAARPGLWRPARRDPGRRSQRGRDAGDRAGGARAIGPVARGDRGAGTAVGLV